MSTPTESPVLACADCGTPNGWPCPGTVRPQIACLWQLPLDSERLKVLNEDMTRRNAARTPKKEQSFLLADSARKKLTIKTPGNWRNFMPGDVIAFSVDDKGALVTVREAKSGYSIFESYQNTMYRFEMTRAEAIQLGEELWEVING